jgi:hypothetical protein
MDLGKANGKLSEKDSLILMPLRTFMIHGRKPKHQH